MSYNYPLSGLHPEETEAEQELPRPVGGDDHRGVCPSTRAAFLLKFYNIGANPRKASSPVAGVRVCPFALSYFQTNPDAFEEDLFFLISRAPFEPCLNKARQSSREHAS